MEKVKNFLYKRRLSRRLLKRHVSPAPSPTPSNEMAETESTESLHKFKFELLPFDIRHQILLAVDSIEDLYALVRASPAFHEQYRPRRHFWLWRCLWLDMGHVLIDAYEVSRCNSPSFREKRTRTAARTYLASYHAKRSALTEILPDVPSTRRIMSILTFYTSTIRPMLQQYLSWTSDYRGVMSVRDQLSKTERRRILRSFYRFQYFCNMFGELPGGEKGGRILESEERLALFFQHFEPWEVEEILCINTFTHSKFESIYDNVKSDLHSDNPRFDARRSGLYTPDGAFGSGSSSLEFANGMQTLGLDALWTLLKTQDHDKVVEIVSETKVSMAGNLMTDTVADRLQDRRREANYSERDGKQARRDKMPFTGDAENLPPLSWVTMWRGTYSNMYGSWIPVTFHRWGYIMWDASRLIDSRALNGLDEEWTMLATNYMDEYDDPRDSII